MDLMDVVSLATAVMGVVLGAAGVAKFVEPAATATTLVAIGLPGGRAAARGLGLAETAVALWLLATGSRPAASVAAATYLLLTATVVTLRRRSPTTPCGCFGAWSGPPSARHVIINVAGVASCSLAAATGAAVAPTAASTTPAAVAWWLVVAVCAGAVIIVLARRRSTPPTDSHTTRTPNPGHTRHATTREANP